MEIFTTFDLNTEFAMKIEETNKLLDFADFRKYSDTIIETGTGGGDGVRQMLKAGFSAVNSIEAKDTYYTNCNEMFKSDPRVSLWFGMSKDQLPNILISIWNPMVFFLDAHVSGPNGAGHEDYMKKGNASLYAQDNCLTSELELILAHRKDHVIIIDDQNGENPENVKYREMIVKANPNYRFYFYDEHRDGGTFYKNKSLVCIPE